MLICHPVVPFHSFKPGLRVVKTSSGASKDIWPRAVQLTVHRNSTSNGRRRFRRSLSKSRTDQLRHYLFQEKMSLRICETGRRDRNSPKVSCGDRIPTTCGAGIKTQFNAYPDSRPTRLRQIHLPRARALFPTYRPTPETQLNPECAQRL